MLFAGLQDKQPSMVIPPMDIPLCSPAVVPIDKYLFAFPATDTVVKLPLEYYDMLLCTTQSANLLLLPPSVTTEPISATICQVMPILGTVRPTPSRAPIPIHSKISMVATVSCPSTYR